MVAFHKQAAKLPALEEKFSLYLNGEAGYVVSMKVSVESTRSHRKIGIQDFYTGQAWLQNLFKLNSFCAKWQRLPNVLAFQKY